MLHSKIRLPRNQLHVKKAELGVNSIKFIDDSPNPRVFLHMGDDSAAKKIDERHLPLTSRITCPMIYLYGRYSSFKFK